MKRAGRLGAFFTTAVSVGRLHIVAIAGFGLLTFGWMFTGEYLPGLAAVCAVDWFLVNILNRVVDLEEDRANRIAGTDWVGRFRAAISVLGLGGLAASFALTHALYPEITPYRLGYHLLGLSYNWPVFPGGRRIKELYFWKNTASATGFMLTLFAYPLSMVGSGKLSLAAGVTGTTVVVTATFFFLFELSYEVIYDLRDLQGDTLAGVRTYPVVHGEAVAVRIVDGLLVAASLSLLAGYAVAAVPWRIFVMVVAPAGQAWMYKRMLRRGIRSRDCIAITWVGAALLGCYHLWVLAELPGV